jgi:hypothetical protein
MDAIHPGVAIEKSYGMSKNGAIVKREVLLVDGGAHTAPHAGSRNQDNYIHVSRHSTPHTATLGTPRKASEITGTRSGLQEVWVGKRESKTACLNGSCEKKISG